MRNDTPKPNVFSDLYREIFGIDPSEAVKKVAAEQELAEAQEAAKQVGNFRRALEAEGFTHEEAVQLMLSANATNAQQVA